MLFVEIERCYRLKLLICVFASFDNRTYEQSIASLLFMQKRDTDQNQIHAHRLTAIRVVLIESDEKSREKKRVSLCVSGIHLKATTRQISGKNSLYRLRLGFSRGHFS